MEKKRKQHILLLYKSMIPSVRLCGHCQLEYLAEKGKIDYRPRTVMQVSKDDLTWAEIVLLCRLDNVCELRLAQALKQSGRQVIYVIDDDLLNVPGELTSGKYYARKDIRRSIQAMIDLSDAVLSPSPVLLEKYAVSGRRGILLEEPAIDPVPYVRRDTDRPVRIGFAGSVDRTGDLETILRESLLHIHKTYGKRVEFAFFGAVPSFAQELGAQCVPYCDSYDAYRRTLNDLHLDIGLAPMPDTPFHACKHYNKFVEYAASGIVGIFSNVKPYDRIADLFRWPLLCSNTVEDWCTAICDLLENPDRLEELRRRAVQLASNDFSIPVIAESMYRDLAGTPAGKSFTPVKVAALPLLKAWAMIRRAVNGAMRYGLKTPAVVLRKIRNLLQR